MRLFTAVDLPSEVLNRLDRLLVALRPEALVKWSPVDNLHITTKFVGQWDESRLDELDDALSSLRVREPFEVELEGLGWFPNERSPRVLWIGAHGGSQLLSFGRATDQRLEKLGIKREDREFAPHLTLARIKSPVSLSRLRRKIDEMQPATMGKFFVTSFALFR
ncbi:MAG: RNA 2',3'-cyclic phosphodiesterase, partial [Bryobacteraceae bacterium]